MQRKYVTLSGRSLNSGGWNLWVPNYGVTSCDLGASLCPCRCAGRRRAGASRPSAGGVTGERVGAQWPGQGHRAGGRVGDRALDRSRRLAVLYPVDHRGQRVSGAGPAALTQCCAPGARNSRANEPVAAGLPMAFRTRW